MPDGSPNSLFKYQRFNFQYLYDTMLDDTVWFSSPLSFNDPFDCRPFVDLTGSADEWRAWISRLVARRTPPLSSKTHHQEIERLMQAVADQGASAVFRGDGREALAETIDEVGVLSLAPTGDNILLWSHYGDHHRGICFKFCRKYEPFRSAYPVLYSEDRPIFRPLDPNRLGLMERFLLYKAVFWKEECEWRAIGIRQIGKIRILPEALEAVIVGDGCPADHVAAVVHLASRRTVPVAIMRAKLDPRSFKLHLEEVLTS